MKPWNFHAYNDSDWKKHYDPVAFYKWRRIQQNVQHLLRRTQRTICDNYLDTTTNITHFPVQDQFSVMISTYNPERIQHLSLIIRHLLKSEKIHTVFVTWHNPHLDVPRSLFQKIRKADYSRVKVLKQSFDSLNNRFNPSSELQTDSVYIMDDDIYVDINDLEFTFTAWQSYKDSVVGHFPRMHTYDPETELATYKVVGNAPYSIILTKSMFIRSDYLFSYTCLLEPQLHASVDSQLNCEDLGFAMMASGLSGAPPTVVRTAKSMEDFGLRKGISTNAAHMPARSQCISDFISDYWHKVDPLKSSYISIAPFTRPRIRTGNWSRIEKTIMSQKKR
ncbi:glycosyl transferase family 64 domain-containing protein [Mucor mucedo]|uniref:glycosyl transferase family 64 domain-containing protein n=1 Tax=Mucor mucedo TaxID=29922 RepID=UPI00221FA730|nr:glycosyl transferase family 64 domain-containing protein [Mucor mucedo]KAI7891622.1 glycosyl transferase family 64 domain-containing protein [Mucor mucedo]